MKYTCPECNTKDIGELDICDNDCKTIICEECGTQFYFDKDNKIVIDHDPDCGICGDESCGEEETKEDKDV